MSDTRTIELRADWRSKEAEAKRLAKLAGDKKREANEARERFLKHVDDQIPGERPLLELAERNASGDVPAENAAETIRGMLLEEKEEPWRALPASDLDVQPEIAKVLANARLETIGQVADWFDRPGAARSLLIGPEMAELAEAIGLATQGYETGGPVGHSTPGKVDSVPSRPQSSSAPAERGEPIPPRRGPLWDVLLRYGIEKPHFLETIKARSKAEALRIAREEIPARHMQYFGRPPTVEYHLSGLIVRRATAAERARDATRDRGARQLKRSLEHAGAEERSLLESQPSDPEPMRPRGKRARATVTTPKAGAKQTLAQINKTANRGNVGAG